MVNKKHEVYEYTMYTFNGMLANLCSYLSTITSDNSVECHMVTVKWPSFLFLCVMYVILLIDTLC